MTLAAITMTAPEAASPVQMYRATYSPDDNKLRLYAASRLDPETYKKVHDAGFRWAPKQALFVAPAWTPGREDVLLSLAGEIEDEDSTLAERQEARAERFTGYSGKRASESAQALDEVERLAAMIPPGQPILVGHHSERRARRDAQRIENGMKRAVMLFERAEYWEERARSALLHAKYKERPDVRWRRIKKIEADLRKAEKTIAQSQKYLTMWRAESLDLNMAKLISSYDRISACFPLDTYPRPAEKSQYEGSRSLWSALDDDIITTEQAREIAIRCHERQIQRQQRWVITITQNIVDFDSDKASSAARAAWGNSSYKIILKQSAKEFAKYNQLYPDQFLPLQRDMIGKFGAAKDQWFSSFLLQVENHSSWHRLFVDPLSRAMYSSDGPDFEFVQQKRKEGLSIHEAVWQLAWKKSGPEMASLEAWLEEHEKYRSVA